MDQKNIEKIKSYFSQIKGLRVAAEAELFDSAELAKQYNFLLEKIISLVDEDLKEEISHLKIESQSFGYTSYGGGSEYVKTDVFRSKITQLVYWLENRFAFGDKFAVVGGLIHQIKDSEIQSRCLDLLAANDSFDRAISEATRIFENRLSKKTGSSLKGTKLVNETVKSNPQDSVLKVSEDKDIQEGFANICRGIMLYFRNPNHHTINPETSKEDAIKICAFIDLVLQDLEKAKIQEIK
ncbi:MAG: TIGR02391 family protein [Candidatus Gracilibacteria bacterium]|jgi:uncharacterized protein (TIGR02391 family)